MGMLYAWASPEYLLEKMSIEQIFMYYDHGVGIMTGKPSGPNRDKPNVREFYKHYGHMIKQPGR